MNYEPYAAAELLPAYPEDMQEKLLAAEVGAPDWEDLSRTDKYNRLGSLVGGTALQAIEFDDARGTVYAKLELQSLTGSHCDRQLHALRVMEDAKLIFPGFTVLDETTSGSLGSQLAVHGPLMGYQVHIRAPELTEKRRASMQLPGVELEIVDGYIPEAATAMVNRLRSLGKEGWEIKKHYTDRYRALSATHPDGRHIVFPNHSANQVTVEAASTIGQEMVQQLGDIRLDAVVLAVGNGTSIHGNVPVFRMHQPQAAFFGVEDARNHPAYDDYYGIHPMLRRYSAHDSFGSSASGTPITFKVSSRAEDKQVLDGIDVVAPQPRDLVRDQFNADYPDIAAGNTSAMALTVAKRIMQRLDKKTGAAVGLILYDSISRY